MNRFERKITVRVLGIHLAVVAFVLIQSTLHGCFRPTPKPEIVTFVQIPDSIPAPMMQEVAQMSEPEPSDPQPTPPPKVAPIPEPTKVFEPVKKIEEPPKKTVAPPVKKIEPPKPKAPEKPKYTKPKDIKIGPRVKETPKKPTISSSDIKKALSDISAPSSPSGNPNEFAAYEARIYAIFYGAWKRPATAAPRPAQVKISLQSNGRITGRRLVQGSGDAVFDQTVMDAVNDVSMLPSPPAGYPLDNIVVQFRIID